MNLREIQAGESGAAGVAARAGLSILSVGYRAAGLTRDALLAIGLLPIARLPVPVVSVGNLTAGGTGKTPFVAWLARRALSMGRKPGILSRGYGPSPAGTAVSDEGVLLADLLGDAVPQGEDPSRARGGRRLLDAHPHLDLLLLDDGFQHRRLFRDRDVVLLDATNPFGFGKLLPRGLLREPRGALARATAVVVTRAERVPRDAIDALREALQRLSPTAIFGAARTTPRALVDAAGVERPVADLAGRSVFAYAGIGNPEQFERTLADAGAAVVGRWFAPDHHEPTPSDVARLAALARAARADRVVVTRKDLVKLRALPALPDGLVALDVVLDIVEGEEALVAHALPTR